MAKQIKFRTHKRRVKFDSIREAAAAAGVPYMTYYMRINKLGMSPSEASKKPVRSYCKRNANLPCCDVFGPIVVGG